ncbi:MAG: FecR domain-containing protein [Armatimonadetes bacterium]|nr:FecR domain-containing protein [Armatimonadota bacterium]
MPIHRAFNRLLFAVALCCAANLSWGQYSIISGEYRGEGSTGGSLSLLVARPSGKNWTVKGTLKTYKKSKGLPVSGTLYSATNKLSLRVTGIPQNAVLDGHFDPETGTIEADFKAKSATSELHIQSFSCKNKNQKAEMETVWVLEAGYPKRCESFTEEMAKGITVDPEGGTVTWKNIPKHDGSKVDQVIKFTVPKNEYRQGEKLLWTLDASGCAHDTPVVEGLHMALGWDGQGWAFAIDWGDSSYGKAVGWRPKWEPVFSPPARSRVRFVVRQPYDLYEWWYAPVSRPKKPAVKPEEKPPVKPPSTTGSGGTPGKPAGGGGTGPATTAPKPPTLRVVAMTGNVQVRKNNSLQWVDFKDALPLKVGDMITTSFDEEIEFALPDGATLRMEPNSTIKVGPLLQAGGQRTQAIMDMVAGRVFVRATSRPGFAGGDFVLRRNETGVSPRGTAFSVAFDEKSKMMQVHVDEGEVTITNKGEQPIILKAGETWARQYLDGG